ncbi:MAG: acyl-CoA thioesterase [Deltaproteobacteria bacterium]|nr:acyl-CoA thioesterase [Deltaproteobacteria bacterium]
MVRVRYADTDQMGVVYHARYFEWFEAARTEMLRSMGMPYRQLEVEGVYLPVIESFCRYRRPVKYDELVEVKTRLVEVTRSRIRLDYEIWGDEEKTSRIQGYTAHCFMNRDGRSVRAPLSLVSFLQNCQIGPMSED